MQIESTGFEGLMIIQPRVFGDDRGYFFESYNEAAFQRNGLNFNWVQDNQSRSKYGVIRGLHFQKPPFAQTKLIRVLSGEILDSVVDLRKEQPTFGKSFSVVLSSDNHRQLLVPKGFAHGFSVLSDSAEVLYKCDTLYNKESEWGILYSDPALSIDWRINDAERLISEKDKELPLFKDLPPLF
jgi:dTDP-4-dehydrorhamnose 3,5-epimerase